MMMSMRMIPSSSSCYCLTRSRIAITYSCRGTVPRRGLMLVRTMMSSMDSVVRGRRQQQTTTGHNYDSVTLIMANTTIFRIDY